MEEFKLNDEVIANIAKLLQIAILTGTDITDNMRTLRLTDLGSGVLGVHEDFRDRLESNIKGMLSAIENKEDLSE